jgi:hypothetical protein
MFILGHAGIGSRLAALVPRVRAAHAPGWLLLGTLLPDLIDKPLYYAMKAATGREGADLGLISCTRTVGHSALFALLVWLVLRALGRHAVALAVLAGMATHWLLDLGGDVTGYLVHALGKSSAPASFSSARALLFPLMGGHFAISPFHSAREHLTSLVQTYTMAGELVGGVLLVLAWRKNAARDGGTPAGRPAGT